MAYEDFTTFTEVDGAAYVTIVNATKCTGNAMTRLNTAYIYKDYGAGHFDDFEHLHDAKMVGNAGAVSSYAAVWGISTAQGDVKDWATSGDGLCVFVWSPAVQTPRFMLYESDAAPRIDDSINFVKDTMYYLTTKRVGTTLTCKIYSDSARTVLVDTLTLLTVDTQAYRYMYPVASYDTGTAGKSISLESLNLDLQEGETHTPSDTAGASDALTFKAEVPIEDTAKASDSVSFFKGLRFSIGDTAKASDDLTFGAEINLEDTAKATDLFESDAPADIYPCSTFTLYGTSTTILFPKPEWAKSINKISKNIDLFNFRSGDLDIVDSGINAQPLTIGGTVFICTEMSNWRDYAAMTTWLNSIKTAMNNGETFEINELGNCLNGVYIIKNFGFDTQKGVPDSFIWKLYLERVKDI